MFQEHKIASRIRRKLNTVSRITNLIEAGREGLTIPQLRAKRRKERRERLAEANRRRRALAEIDDIHIE